MAKRTPLVLNIRVLPVSPPHPPHNNVLEILTFGLLAASGVHTYDVSMELPVTV